MKKMKNRRNREIGNSEILNTHNEENENELSEDEHMPEEEKQVNTIRTTINKEKSTNAPSLIKYLNSCDRLNVISLLVTLIALTTMAYIGIDECKRCFHQVSEMQTSNANQTLTANRNQLSNDNDSLSLVRRTYWTFLRKTEDAHLKHVYKVLNAFGYANNGNNNNVNDWDLLWAHDYPFVTEYNKLKELKPHQKVNHLPGCGYITTKVELSTSNLKYILPAFKLPADKDKLLNYTSKYPMKKFVLKHNEHRHIRIKSIDEIQLDLNGSFVQEFMDNPLLVSGHMFDIGIYTIITSIDPLRIYIYNGDVLLRFCPATYKPFDRENLDKYVVGDDYLPIWEVPKIQYWYKKLGYGMRESLSAYLVEEGRDPKTIWRQIEEAIAIAIHDKQGKIIDVVKRFKSKRNFFEMMRFDFLVDNKLNVHLLEANMSPNLSSAHFKPNQLLYEQVLFNLFGLVGLGDRIQKPLGVRNDDDRAMETSEKNILVLPNICSSAICRNNCEELDCKLCKVCLNENKELQQDLYDAHKEYLNRGDCKRIFPPTLTPYKKLPADVLTYTTSNQLMYLWFQEKCNLDNTWC